MKLLCLLLVSCAAAVSVYACPTLYKSRDGQSGVLSSNYGYPWSCNGSYSHNLDCNYELISGRNNRGRGVQLSFDFFNTETRYDRVYIEYTDSRGRRVTGYFTGRVGPFSRRLSTMRGSTVTLRWVTDGSVSSSGFLLRYRSIGGRRFRLGGEVEFGRDGASGSFRIVPAKRK